MDRLAYLSMTGAQQILQAQQNNSHNLANANTPGFKADLNAFKSLPVYGPGHPSRAFVADELAGYDFSSGTLAYTGRDLDVAVSGKGWIAVQAEDGSEAYTRRGDLRISTNGLLSNGAGELVLGNAGPIAIPPHQSLLIGNDGTISIRPLGQEASTLAAVDRIRLVNPETSQLEKGTDGLFRTTNGINAEPDAAVHVVSGSLEESNVNAVDSMIKMIEFSRSFEAQIKLMKVVEENDQSSARLLRNS